jgi:hypothetical protein
MGTKKVGGTLFSYFLVLGFAALFALSVFGCGKKSGGTKTETSEEKPCPVWFKDVDKDGYTDGTTKVSCKQPDGYVPQALPGDCNDDDKNLNPNTVWFKDKDKDGYTDGTTKVSCTKPSDEYVLSALLLDCNDNDPNINPGKMEICDGLDNDCDGQTDEGFNVGQSCSVGLGECARTGQYVCRADGFGTECNARAGNPSLEICDGKDNDCNGQIDENLTRACYTGPAGTQGVGECKAGIQVCTNGVWGPCQGEVLPQSEICDNKDNDCDGQIDEEFNVGQSCTVGVGECARTGQYVCKADGSGTQCNATPGTPTAEICDGRDNDCDGQIDEEIICVKVSAGSYHTCAIDTNGSLWCWGDNWYGQLGDGTNVGKDVPVQVSGTNWFSVSAGDGHTCGIKTDEILWCWGDNWYGQLGDGTNVGKNVPVEVSGTNWVSVSAGGEHTCGIKTNGTLWCWGRNNYGQLGDGTNVGKNAPVRVSGTNWVSVSAGKYHTCGVKTDGTIWCWGRNNYGQLGDGSLLFLDRNVPTLVCFSCAFYSYSLTTVPFSWDPSADPPFGNVAIENGRDDRSFSLSLPFEFTFYGVTYTTLYIDSNGRLNFFANSSYYYNIPFPCSDDKCKLVIAPLWDDLTTFPSGSEVRYAVVGSPPNRRLVVTWYGVSHYSYGGSFTFQAILYEGTNQILFQYHTISGTYTATIGVNRGDGIRHTSYTSSVASGTALLFTPSSP